MRRERAIEERLFWGPRSGGVHRPSARRALDRSSTDPKPIRGTLGLVFLSQRMSPLAFLAAGRCSTMMASYGSATQSALVKLDGSNRVSSTVSLGPLDEDSDRLSFEESLKRARQSLFLDDLPARRFLRVPRLVLLPVVAGTLPYERKDGCFSGALTLRRLLVESADARPGPAARTSLTVNRFLSLRRPSSPLRLLRLVSAL